VTVAGSERATTEQIRQARANEQPEPVYAPRPMSDEQAAAFLGKSVDEIRAMRAAESAKPLPTARAVAPALVDPSGQPVSSTPAPPALRPATSLRRAGQSRPSVEIPAESVAAPSPVVAGVPPSVTPVVDSPLAVPEVPTPLPAPAGAPSSSPPPATTLASVASQLHPRDGIPDNEPYRPAASDTDTPSRGLPTAQLPKDKVVTGGFGDVGEAQYYGLDGREVLALINAQLDALRTRIQNDLRFSIAAVYPRLSARVVIEVDCFAEDTGFQIERKLVPAHTKTPMDVARRHADACCFCIIEEHVEMTDDGQSVTPPNQVRLDLGLDVPRKHAVKLPNKQTLLVDIS
jgi:hypothetical protein